MNSRVVCEFFFTKTRTIEALHKQNIFFQTNQKQFKMRERVREYSCTNLIFSLSPYTHMHHCYIQWCIKKKLKVTNYKFLNVFLSYLYLSNTFTSRYTHQHTRDYINLIYHITQHFRPLPPPRSSPSSSENTSSSSCK